MLESGEISAPTRTIDILNLITCTDSCSVATIIDTLGIPKSTAYLLPNEFRRQHSLNLDHQGNFCLWTRLVELSGHALSKMDPRELARSHLTQLTNTTGLLCHLGITDNGGVYYILKVESSAAINVRFHEGRNLPLCRSGMGKRLFAQQPVAVQQGIIEGLVREQTTPITIIHPQQLYEELARIRRQGQSYDNGENYADIRCVTAPVFNANNELTTAISVTGTRSQINEEYHDCLAGKAIACARDISRLLGWKGPFDLQAS